MRTFSLVQNWTERAALIGIAALLIIFLADAIANRSISYDEGITLLQTSGHPRPAWPTDATPVEQLKGIFQESAGWQAMTTDLLETDIHPPLYYWLARLWRSIAGPELAALRWLSAACVVGQAMLMLAFGAQLKQLALAGLIFALSGLATEFGVRARDYAFASLLILLAMLAAASETRLRNAALAGLAMTAAVATHYLAWFPIGALLAILLVRSLREKRAVLLVPIAMVALAAVYLIPLTLRASRLRPDQFAGFRGMGVEFKALALSVLYGVASEHSLKLSVWLGRLGLLLIAGLLLAGAVRSLLRFRRDPRAAMVTTICVVHLAAVFLLFLANDKTLTARNTMNYAGMVFPATVLLLAYGIEALPKKLGRAACIAVLAFQAAQIRFGQDLPGPSPRKIARAVQPGSTVVIANGNNRAIVACMLQELPAGARICAVTQEGACGSSRSNVDLVVGGSSAHRELEKAFQNACQDCRVHRFF